jgi:hypothetical protein
LDALQRFRHHFLAMLAPGIAIESRGIAIERSQSAERFISHDNAIVMHCSILLLQRGKYMSV